MSAEAAHNALCSRRRITDASNDPTLQFEDTVNKHMESLHQHHQPNAKYKKDFPVFLHPTDPNQYIPLTAGAVQTWALALVSMFSFKVIVL